MNPCQRILAAAAALTLLLVHGAPSSAQVNPADMRSGSLRVTTGVTPVVLFTVPAGEVFVLTDIEWSTTANSGDASPVPPGMQMQQNAPNPFNPETRISYSLGEEAEARLRVFDSSGRLVRTLVCERQDAGEYSVVWDGSGDDGRELGSGVYFYELTTGEGRESRKAVMLR